MFPRRPRRLLSLTRSGRVRRSSLRAAFLSLLACVSSAAERPNVLLITLDTTRKDHLGLYGYEQDTSPNLDRLARDSMVYTRAFSVSSWTLPAHASLFTGLFPTTHGAHYDAQGALVLSEGIRGTGVLAKFRASPLTEDSRVLAEILGAAGYATGGIVAGPWLKRVFGLGRGFAHYDDSSIDDVHGRLADDVTARAKEWIDARGADPEASPFFLFLNYYDPHVPYTDPEGYARKFLPPNTVVFPPPTERTPEFLRGVYDGEIHYMDEHLGTLFDHLKTLGLYDEMLVVVTADHGELLGEHGREGHGNSLHEEELRVPLLVKYPLGEGKRGRSETPVQLTDVLPLILGQVGIEVPAAVQGGAKPADRPPVYAEIYPLLGPHPVLDWRVSVEGDFKYVWTSDGEQRLFDIARDPGEITDLGPKQPKRMQEMAERQQRFVSGLPVARKGSDDTPVQTIDEQTLRALKGLGYIE